MPLLVLLLWSRSGTFVHCITITLEFASLYFDAWSGAVVGLFERTCSFCTVLCVWPLDVGIFYVFCALFRLLNVGQKYNDIISL